MPVGFTLDGFGTVVTGNDENLVFVGAVGKVAPAFIAVVRDTFQDFFAAGWAFDEAGLETVITVDLGDKLDVAGEVGTGDFEHGARAFKPVNTIT